MTDRGKLCITDVKYENQKNYDSGAKERLG